MLDNIEKIANIAFTLVSTLAIVKTLSKKDKDDSK